MMVDYQKWKDGLTVSIGISLFLAFASCWIAFMFLENFLLCCLLGFCVMIFSFTIILKNHRESTFKFFFVDTETAKQGIKNVLDTKGIPYKQEKNCFFVDILTITVKRQRTRRTESSGSIIKIRPNKLIYEPLIGNLKSKFDDELIPDWE